MIASGQGAPATHQPQAQVYHQPNTNLPGFNPNEEHALLTGGRLYALRCDLNDAINPKASEPYVLLKYPGPDATNDWRMRVFQVVAEEPDHTFANFANRVAGVPVALPAPLSSARLCASSNRIAFGAIHAHQAWNGTIYAKSAGYFQVQYWYPTQPDFYFGTNQSASRHLRALDEPVSLKPLVTPGGTRCSASRSWWVTRFPGLPTCPSLEFAETLTTRKHGLPDLLNFASARVIYDDGNPPRH